MDFGGVLIIVGIVLAIFVNYALGVLLIVIGVILLLLAYLPRLRR